MSQQDTTALALPDDALRREPAPQYRMPHPLTLRSAPAATGRSCDYVVKSLEAALWAFCDGQDFREAVLKAVNLGDDADTTGAVCGQLAGACWGESEIPAEWLKWLARRDMIEQALDGLVGGAK